MTFLSERVCDAQRANADSSAAIFGIPQGATAGIGASANG
jgi:hypothetical protein